MGADMRPDWFASSEWGPALMSRRPECITGFALVCAATAIAACGLVPREDRSERTTLSRTYPIEMQSLASCADDVQNLSRK